MTKPSSDAMAPVVLALCEAVGTPRALSVWLCFKYNQEALVRELPMTDPATNDTQLFARDYFITEYLSKYKALKIPNERRSAALEKWRLSEVRCRETNRRFSEQALRPICNGRVEARLFRAQRKIARVLGPLVLPRILDGCKWGPGATFDLKRRSARPDNKISKPLSVTASALGYLRAVVESDPHWGACFTGILPEGRFSLLPSCFKLVRGSRFLTVPKNAKIDRCIAAEPTGNGFLQQGVHKYMRHRLKRFGVDLDDQSINQQLARRAYAEQLATLDLSAASDTISTELVFSLLPLDWALFLDALRSRETRVDGKWVRTEKFASMGNAFCFELETLIFWALASSVVEESGDVAHCEPLSVYGDDIIVPGWAADEVVLLLEHCGFAINKKKSYLKGNFFESCGKHYHRGQDVTPTYQVEPLEANPEYIRAHNRIYRLWKRLPWLNLRRSLRIVSQLYDWHPFPRIPEGCSEDGGFLRPLGEFSLDPNHGYRCQVLDYVPVNKRVREEAMYAYKLRKMPKDKVITHLTFPPEAHTVNVLKTGHAAWPVTGRWRSTERWLPEWSTITSPDVT